MKTINLTKNKKAFVDDEDYNFINSFKWYASKNRNVFYATRIKLIDSKRVKINMHRLILGLTKQEMQVDHIDNNGLNNQKSNLRICSISQNGCNRKVSKSKKSSQYLGVFNNNGYWYARCRHNGILHSQRAFNEADAALKYNDMAKLYHKEFAKLNEVREVFI